MSALLPATATADIELGAPVPASPVSERAGDVSFTVTRDCLLQSGTASVPVELVYGTAGAADATTATRSVDLKCTLAGTARATFKVTIADDKLYEGDESFAVKLGAPSADALGKASERAITIADDDPPPTVSIGSGRVTEGTGSGTTNLDLPVTVTPTPVVAVKVQYALAAGSASAGTDFDPTGGDLTIAPGQTGGVVRVAVVRDSVDEPDETLTATLSAPVNATLGTAIATGTIDDDDPSTSSGAAPPGPGPVGALPSSGGAGPSGGASQAKVAIGAIAFHRPRTVSFPITCAVTVKSCRISLALFNVRAPKAKIRRLRNEITLGKRVLTLARGQTATVALPLSARNLALLKQAKAMKVRAYAVVRDDTGDISVDSRSATIRR